MKPQKFRNYFISDFFDKALAIDPKNVRALTNKGLALGALGKYNESPSVCSVIRNLSTSYEASKIT
jgi:hypothetical protein